MLFALMKTMARIEENRKQEQEKKSMRYAYELRVQKSVGFQNVSLNFTKLSCYLNTTSQNPRQLVAYSSSLLLDLWP